VAIEVRVQPGVIDVAAEIANLAPAGDDGAMACFTGFCRDDGGTLIALELEHWPGVAERQITRFAQDAAARFGASRVLAVHRHGTVKPGEVIVFVAALSRHRDAAFDAARYVMDFLKTDAPFWKKEHRRDGSTGWVAAKDADDTARERWRAHTPS
jgi:molybdopterin synthase catalytic subunit